MHGRVQLQQFKLKRAKAGWKESCGGRCSRRAIRDKSLLDNAYLNLSSKTVFALT